jgi:2'-5' RNA ligase
MPRLFVAVEVPWAGLARIATFPPDQPPHLTLQFLGDLPDVTVPGLVDALAVAIGPIAPFAFELVGVGAFPRESDPRVVWVGVRQGRAEFEALAARVREAVREAVGRSERKAFFPHVTLFRVRRPEQLARARALLEGHGSAEFGGGIVTAVELKASRLERAGAVHSVVASLSLRGTAAAGR